MRTVWTGLGSLMLAVATGCTAAPSPDWDPEATKSLEAECDAMLRLIDAGDFDGMLARIDPDAVVFDMDLDNAPVQLTGKAAIAAMFDGFREAMKSQGLTIRSTVVRRTAHATATMGYVAVEFDQTFTMGAEAMGPIKFRGTMVARRFPDGWRWDHWHGSFREPVMPAGAAVTFGDDDGKDVPGAGMGGAQPGAGGGEFEFGDDDEDDG